jgi:hypothetical protein
MVTHITVRTYEITKIIDILIHVSHSNQLRGQESEVPLLLTVMMVVTVTTYHTNCARR